MPTMTERKKAYAKALNGLIRRYAQSETQLLEESGQLLRELRRQVLFLLNDVDGDTFTSYRLGELNKNITTLIAGYDTRLKGVTGSGVENAYNLGIFAEREPYQAAQVSFAFYTPNDAQVAILTGFSGDLISGVSANMLKRINLAIKNIALGVASPYDTQRAITAMMGFTPRGKLENTGVAYEVERIIRTELGRAFNVGAMAQAEANLSVVPELKKRWIATADDRTRDSHIAAHLATLENPIPLKQAFRVGNSQLMYPLDPMGEAKETINCRCRMVTVHPELGVVRVGLDDKIKAVENERQQ